MNRPEEEKTVGLLLPRVPRYYTSIRTPSNGLFEWLKRKKRLGQNEAVRGLPIAAEALIDSLLLKEPGPFSSRIFCGGPLAAFENWAKTEAAGPHYELVQVESLSENPQLTEVRLWYEPQANYSLVYQIRDRLSSTLYPIVSTVHGISIHTGLFEQFTRVLICDTSPADVFVCSSRASQAALIRLFASLSDVLEQRYGIKRRFRGRFETIPLPVDIDRYLDGDKVRAKQTLGIPRTSTTLLYLGLVSPLKADLFPCILALSECRTDVEQHDVVFCIAGGGDDAYFRAIALYARDVGFPVTRLRLIKDPPDKLKHTLIEAADIFTSPADSLQEAFGLTVVEAMACGVPQVVADWDGYRDTVHHGVTGFLIPTRWAQCDGDLRDTGLLLGWAHDHHMLGQSVAIDIDEWKKAVTLLIKSPELRQTMSAASRQRANVFAFDRVRKQYHDLWTDLTTLPIVKKDREPLQLERPSYFDCFQGFASHFVGIDTVLTPVRVSLREIIIRHSNRVRPCVIPELLHVLFAIVDEERTATIGTILSRIEMASSPQSPPWPPQTTMRHIMWALKQGLLQPPP